MNYTPLASNLSTLGHVLNESIKPKKINILLLTFCKRAPYQSREARLALQQHVRTYMHMQTHSSFIKNMNTNMKVVKSESSDTIKLTVSHQQAACLQKETLPCNAHQLLLIILTVYKQGLVSSRSTTRATFSTSHHQSQIISREVMPARRRCS